MVGIRRCGGKKAKILAVRVAGVLRIAGGDSLPADAQGE